MPGRPLRFLAAVLLASCTSAPPVVSVQCGADETVCGANCARLKVDDLNCGSCGRACGAGEACANGA